MTEPDKTEPETAARLALVAEGLMDQLTDKVKARGDEVRLKRIEHKRSFYDRCLAERLEDPEFRAAYERELRVIGERHTEQVVFRLSPRLHDELWQLAEREETSVSEIVREALASRWDLK